MSNPKFAHKRVDKGEYMIFLAMTVLLFAAGKELVACKASTPAAEAKYLEEQLTCVDVSATKSEAVACINSVRARWAADASAEGSAR